MSSTEEGKINQKFLTYLISSLNIEALPRGGKNMMEVIKRDGTREVVKMERILHAVTRACRGLDKVEPIEIAKRTISGLHNGSTTKELDDLSISNAVMLMADEPNYSKVAARMFSESIRKFYVSHLNINLPIHIYTRR